MHLPFARRPPLRFRVAGETLVLALARDAAYLLAARHERVELAGLGLRRLLIAMVASEGGARQVAELLGVPSLRPEPGAWTREVVGVLRSMLARGTLVLLRDVRARSSDNQPLPVEPPGPPGPVPPIEPPEPIVDKSLIISVCDHHFAPGVESEAVTYLIRGLVEDEVFVEITSEQFPGKLIYKRVLEPGEKGDGDHELCWDGRCNQPGEWEDRLVNPLFSPFKVKIEHDSTYTDEAEFHVLYHSLELERGPWTPDEEEPDEAAAEKDWVQYKLDELGYYGGPVAKDTDDYLKKAIIRYKFRHPDFHELDYSDYDDSITPELRDALRAGLHARTWIDDAALRDPAARGKLRVEALTYEDGEFGSHRAPLQRDRLNRPIVPIEAKVLLRRKNDAPVFSPGAVGEVRVNWRFIDADEDLSSLDALDVATSPSKTGKFVKKALELHDGRKGEGDNCWHAYDGVRKAAADNYKQPLFVGDAYLPYVVEDDGANKVVFSKAWADAGTHEKRLGRAGMMLRTSFIAGDDYKVRAELDFTGLPNEDALETAHEITDEDSRIRGETGTLTIERFNNVAMVVTWPARSGGNPWAAIAAEFAHAHIDVDTSSVAVKAIDDILTEARYKTIVANNTAHAEADVSLDTQAVVGVALPAQGNRTAGQYKTLLKTFSSTNYLRPIRDDVHAELRKVIRKTHPAGWIFLEFLVHRPVDIQTAPPGDTTVTAANTGYVTWAVSWGLSDSIIFADQKDPDKVYYVLAHEMGHNLWLYHWENAGGSASDHDADDHNCIMSYSTNSGPAHQAQGVYEPRFCGECNLKLRGWDTDHADIPANSS